VRINDGLATLLFLPWFGVFFTEPDKRDARISKAGGNGVGQKGPPG
jgi:hypothetical protein